MSSTATARASARKQQRSSYAVFRGGGMTPEIQLTVQMVLAARRWRSLLDEHLREIGQSSARMEAISAIVRSPPLPAQIDIARRLRIEGPTLTRMLDSLEKDGLVERLPDAADRRTNKLRVTQAGEDALEEIFTVVDELRARLLAGIEPETITELNAFFAGVLDRLDAGLPAPGDE